MSNNPEREEVSMSYLIRTFLKVGTISFGGFMALIAVLQKEMVERDGKIKDNVLLDGVGLASILPGPVAVNTVGYVGYYLRGFWGAILSMGAVIFPCFTMVLALSIIYFEFGDLDGIKTIIGLMLPAIVVIILSVGISMAKKHISDKIQYAIGIASFAVLYFVSGVWATVGVILMGAFLGYILYGSKTNNETNGSNHSFKLPIKLFYGIGIVLCIILIGLGMIFLIGNEEILMLNSKVLMTFSSMSLSLFGGGYVIIPIIQETIVSELNWLSLDEFNTAIALSQVTPGPILISATFIGYKVAGIPGAFLATAGIFLPSGMLIITCSHYLHQVSNSSIIKAIFKGLRPAIIGLVFSAAVTIGSDVLNELIYVIAFGVMLPLTLRYQLSAIWVILGSMAIGSIGALL